uniref:Coatomer subunit gamma n=2 Tax=Panagrolaimus TaxID=55784 RepID=A0A914YH92_9BILA
MIPLPQLPYSQLGTTYAILKDESLTATFGATLKFKVVDVDPTTGEPESDEFYDDSYVLEEVEIQLGDHIQGLIKANFSSAWETAGEENEVEETYSLSTYDGLQDAVQGLLKFLSMSPCEHSEKVAEGKSSHTLLLSGKFRSGQDVVAKVRLALDPSDNSVTMNIIVRGEDKDISEVIANAIS